MFFYKKNTCAGFPHCPPPACPPALLPTCPADEHLPAAFRGALIPDRLYPEWGTHKVGGRGRVGAAAAAAAAAGSSAWGAGALWWDRVCARRFIQTVSVLILRCAVALQTAPWLQLVEATRSLLWEAFKDPLNTRCEWGGGGGGYHASCAAFGRNCRAPHSPALPAAAAAQVCAAVRERHSAL